MKEDEQQVDWLCQGDCGNLRPTGSDELLVIRMPAESIGGSLIVPGQVLSRVWTRPKQGTDPHGFDVVVVTRDRCVGDGISWSR